MTKPLLVTGEGQGEVGDPRGARSALLKLTVRTLAAQGHGHAFTSYGIGRFNLYLPGRLEQACEYARSARAAALLMTSDSEDGCPSEDAPGFAERVRALKLPFPVAVVLFHREYETLFVSVADRLAGKVLTSPAGESFTLTAGAAAPLDPESRRDAKGWVSELLLDGAPYKPTTHQLPMTRAVEPLDLRRAGLSSFRRFERGVDHLAVSVTAGRTAVYPS